MTRYAGLPFCPATVMLLATLGALHLPVPAIAQWADTTQLKQTITQLSSELRELEDTKTKIDSGHVLLPLFLFEDHSRCSETECTYEDDPPVVLVERERVESLFVLLLSEGKISGRGVAVFAAGMGKLTRGYVKDNLEPELAELRRRVGVFDAELQRFRGAGSTPVAPAAGLVTQWPTPMEWQKVRGVVTGQWDLQCRDTDGTPLWRVTDVFQLVLTGDGTATAQFQVQGDVFAKVSGTIRSDGSAAGSGSGTGSSGGQWTLSWEARFGRSGDRLTMTSASLRVVYSRNIACEPGSMTQQ